MEEKKQEIQELTDEELDEVAGGLRISLRMHEFYCTKCKKAYFSNKKSVTCKKCKTILAAKTKTNSMRTL